MTLTLPWDYVLHDNHRLMPIKVGNKARLATAPAYRMAKKAAEQSFAAQWRGPKLVGNVILVATVWCPDLRKRDAGNYRKLLTDSLSGIAYDDDAQLVSETWQKALDRHNPRITIELQEAA